MNKVTLIGRLTRDPELRYTTSEKAVVSFTLAVDRFKKGEADFMDCIAWDKRAEVISQYFRKGNKIAVCGRIQVRGYEDKEGNKRRAFEVVVDEFEFMESKKTETESEPETPSQYVEVDDDSELPF
jgi:single-strand DNA-binding protein